LVLLPTTKNLLFFIGKFITYSFMILIQFRPVEEGLVPVRQPKGPDGTNGFSEEYRKKRTGIKV
jgi:hypothetical protein